MKIKIILDKYNRVSNLYLYNLELYNGIEIDIDKDLISELQFDSIRYCFENGILAIKDFSNEELEYYNDNKEKEIQLYAKEQQLRLLRLQREQECFSVINRGPLWYDTLSLEQKDELKQWYSDWLNVTETLIEPETPKWLK